MPVAGGGGQAASASDGGVRGGDGTAATAGHSQGGTATIGSDGMGGRLGQADGQTGGQTGLNGDPQSTGGSTRTGGSTGTGASAGRGSGTGGASAGGGVAGTSSASGGGGGNAGRGSGGAGGGGRVGTAGSTGRAGSGGAISSGGGASACRQAPVPLGVAGDFAVLAGSTVTSTGLTLVTGQLGTSPGTAVTGFPPGSIIGGPIIDPLAGSLTGSLTGSPHAGDPVAAEGQATLTTAYGDAAGRRLCPVQIAGNLGGQTLPPGLYRSTSSLEISSGNLTLDAGGDPSAVWVFQMASTLTTTTGRQVILSGGARSSNVFWQVGTSATLGVSSVFHGTVMADQSITLTMGATVDGRVLARVGAVTLDSNTIVRPAL